MMRMTGARAVLECLKREGVAVVFGYPGGAILPLYEEMYKDNFRHILTGHEQGAVHAADGYARVTGRPGVCRRRPMRTHSSSISWSSVPRLTATPRISSISARVTGW